MGESILLGKSIFPSFILRTDVNENILAPLALGYSLRAFLFFPPMGQVSEPALL
jgi:hypothetical protein